MAGALNARKVEALKEPGRYSDGGNLFLHISPNGGKRWIFAYRGAPKPNSKNNRYEMGLGSAGSGGVSLAEARTKAEKARHLLRQGIDPLEAKRDAAKAERGIPTFGEFADQYVKNHAPKFRNAKHLAQWEMTLGDRYCRALRSLPVNAVDTEAVLSVLQPVWALLELHEAGLKGCTPVDNPGPRWSAYIFNLKREHGLSIETVHEARRRRSADEDGAPRAVSLPLDTGDTGSGNEPTRSFRQAGQYRQWSARVE